MEGSQWNWLSKRLMSGGSMPLSSSICPGSPGGRGKCGGIPGNPGGGMSPSGTGNPGGKGGMLGCIWWGGGPGMESGGLMPEPNMAAAMAAAAMLSWECSPGGTPGKPGGGMPKGGGGPRPRGGGGKLGGPDVGGILGGGSKGIFPDEDADGGTSSEGVARPSDALSSLPAPASLWGVLLLSPSP